jgi:hypothetical protein
VDVLGPIPCVLGTDMVEGPARRWRTCCPRGVNFAARAAAPAPIRHKGLPDMKLLGGSDKRAVGASHDVMSWEGLV